MKGRKATHLDQWTYFKWKTNNNWIKEVIGAQLINVTLIDLIDLVRSEVGPHAVSIDIKVLSRYSGFH